MTAQALMFAVWANNHAGVAGDSVVDVRRLRTADQVQASQKGVRLEADAAVDWRTEEEIEAGTLAELVLAL